MYLKVHFKASPNIKPSVTPVGAVCLLRLADILWPILLGRLEYKSWYHINDGIQYTVLKYLYYIYIF